MLFGDPIPVTAADEAGAEDLYREYPLVQRAMRLLRLTGIGPLTGVALVAALVLAGGSAWPVAAKTAI